VEILDDDRPRRRRRREREEDYEDEPRPRKKSKKKKRYLTRQQMGMTNLGLAFHYAMIITILASMTIAAFAGIVLAAAGASAAASAAGGAGPGGGASGMAAFASFIALLANIAMYFVAPLLGITGSILCCWVPSQTGAKALIIISLVVDCCALLFPVLAIVIVGAGAAMGGLGSGAGALGLILILLCPVCLLAGFILFMLFMRQLSAFLGEHGSADECVGIIVHFLLLFVGAPIGLIAVSVVFFVIIARDRASGASAGGFMGCIFAMFLFVAIIALLVFWIKLLFRILNLIGSLRQTLRSQYNV
jgi:hypothetical protein